jgi:hypothetical protein
MADRFVTRTELESHIDRVVGGASKRIGGLNELQALNVEMMKQTVLMRFDDEGITSFADTTYRRAAGSILAALEK